jgi:tRNA pseudouridine13 synthase
MAQLPYITKDLPGIGGEIKRAPADFVVEEIPLYEPCGDGEHVYVCLTREGFTTRELQRRLAELLGLRDVDVGVAGLKDKQARAKQTFLLWLQAVDEKAVVESIESSLPI